MGGLRLLPLVLLATAVTLSGCVARHAESEGGSTAAQAQPTARAAEDPDLAEVMERFYQQVEGEHWPFADGMITPGYHTRLGMDGVRVLYGNLINIDVTLQQTGSATVVAHLTAKDRGNPGRTLNFIETSRLYWDGQQWSIDEIARRDLNRGAP